jgi:hypothetical protein
VISQIYEFPLKISYTQNAQKIDGWTNYKCGDCPKAQKWTKTIHCTLPRSQNVSKM